MEQVLAMDLGGTVLKAALVDRSGTVHMSRTQTSCEGSGRTAWASSILRLAAECLESATTRLDVVGLSVPGAVDANGVLIDLGSRLDVGEGIDLAEILAPLDLAVNADNDAVGALLAERRWGGATGTDNVAMFTIGTGLGGAVLVQGNPITSADLLAGRQLGHMVVDFKGPKCVCGGRGCAETYVSAPALLRMARQAGSACESAEQVLVEATRGDGAAAVAVESFVGALASAIVNVHHAYGTELVVLGGGVMNGSTYFLDRLRATVNETAWTVPPRPVRIAPSALASDLGVLGAAAVAFRNSNQGRTSL
jgi:glucokinase